MSQRGTSRFVSRRGLLVGLAGVVGVAALQACSAPAAPTATSAPAKPAEAPKPGAAEPTSLAATPAQAAPTQAGASKAGGSYQGKLAVYGVSIAEQGQGKLNDDFEASHPGVKVEYSFMPSAKFVELFTAAQNANEQIDVLILNGQDLRRYATANQLVDLTKEISYQDRFRQIGLKTYTISGKLWALPYGSIGGFPLFYNKAILDKLGLKYPASFQDLVAMKNELKKANVAAFTHSGKEIYLWPVWFFTTYAQTTKNQSIEKTVRTLQGETKFTDPEVVGALDSIFKFGKEGLFIEGVNSLDVDGSTANFLTGKAVFWLQHNGLIRTVREANPPNMALDVALAPQFGTDKIQSQFPGGTGSALAVYHKIDDKRRPVALEYLDFLTQDKNVEWLVKEGKGSVATNKNANPSDDPVAIKFGNELIDQLKIYLDWYWPPQITRAFQENIQAGVGGQKTADQAAKDIQAAFDKLVTDGYKYQD
ncbi:MAG TPA: ABC transporter substrate-binding protein [Chloroflexota bacterium]|nr:ABC transporter substrate-binding protein [Chloroflexota bacterium]